jgi:hypothetical protein
MTVVGAVKMSPSGKEHYHAPFSWFKSRITTDFLLDKKDANLHGVLANHLLVIC